MPENLLRNVFFDLRNIFSNQENIGKLFSKQEDLYMAKKNFLVIYLNLRKWSQNEKNFLIFSRLEKFS